MNYMVEETIDSFDSQIGTACTELGTDETNSQRRSGVRVLPRPPNYRGGEGEYFVVDGTNACFWHGQAFKDRKTGADRASIRPLLVLLTEIREHGDNFFCIFDASTARHLIERRAAHDAPLIDILVRRYPKHFYVVTGDSSADGAIVHFAHRHECRVITNDTRYGDRFGRQFPWLLEQRSTRFIRANFQSSGQLTLERLAYGFMDVYWKTRTGELLERLDSAMSRRPARREESASASRPAHRQALRSVYGNGDAHAEDGVQTSARIPERSPSVFASAAAATARVAGEQTKRIAVRARRLATCGTRALLAGTVHVLTACLARLDH